MTQRNPASTANVAGHPIHPILVTLPIGFFAATLLFDILYWRSGGPVWATGAKWLLAAGLVGAALAAVAGLVDFLGDRRIRAINLVWWHAGGNVLLVLIQLFSFWQRTRHGAEFVMPTGLALSVIAVVLMGVTGWLGGEMVFRHRVAVYDDATATEVPRPRADEIPAPGPARPAPRSY